MAYRPHRVCPGLDVYTEEFVGTLEDQHFIDTGFPNTDKPATNIESKEDIGPEAPVLLFLTLGQLQNNIYGPSPNF